MGEFGETVVKHYRVRDNKEDLDSKLRSNGSEVDKDQTLSPDVPDALRSTREALDLVVASIQKTAVNHAGIHCMIPVCPWV